MASEGRSLRDEGAQAQAGPSAVGARGLASRILRATGAQALSQGLRIVQQLLLVPLFLSAWGVNFYNDWLLLNAGALLLAAIDSGVQPHFSGEIQDRFVSGDLNGYRRVARVACFNYLVIVGMAILAILSASTIVDWTSLLGVEYIPGREADWTLGFLAANTLAMLPWGVVGTLYRAHGEYDRSVAVFSINLTLQITAVSALLWLKQEPPVVAGGLLAASLVSWVIMLADQKIRYARLPWGLAVPARAELKKFGENWAYFMVQPMANWLTVQGPILILGHFGTPAATVAFSTARTAIGLSRQFVLTAAYPFGFELSVLFIKHELASLRRLAENAISIVGTIGGILSGLMLVACGPVMTLWLNRQVDIDGPLIVALSIAAALSAPAQVLLTMLVFANRPRLIAHGYLGQAMLGLLLGALFAQFYGAAGVAAGLGIGELIFIAGYLSFRAARQIGMPGLSTAATGAARAIVAGCVGYALAEIATLVLPPTSYFRLVLFGSIWALLAIPVTFFLLLKSDQRAAILRRLPMSRLPFRPARSEKPPAVSEGE